MFKMEIIKKLLKYLLIIFIVISIILVTINMVLYISICINKKQGIINNIKIRRNIEITSRYFRHLKYNKTSGPEYTKKPIIVFGNDLVNGAFYEDKDNETFSAQLSKASRRPVYDRSLPTCGIQQALIQVQSHTLDKIIKESEYAIFVLPAAADAISIKTYNGNVIDPFFLFNRDIYPRYVLDKNDNLVFHKAKFPFIDGSVLYRIIQKIFCEKLYASNNQNTNLYNDYMFLLKMHFEKLQEELQKINPDIKFAIFTLYIHTDERISDELTDLEENGIIYIDLNEMLDDDALSDVYRKNNNPTPNLWKELAPKIVKELNL